MNPTPLVSIIIPCFNYARYVAAAIEGALAQTQSWPRTEVIVVNDGSTDDSLEVIGRYADRVKIVDQPNGGQIATVNRGFAESSGDIIMFLDADDLMAPGAVAEVVRAWRPGCAKVQYDLAIVDAEGRDLGRRFCAFHQHYGPEEVRASFASTGTYRWPVTSGNAHARTFAAALLPLPLSIKQAADGMLNTLAPLYGDVITIPRVLGAYRVHGGNVWATRGNDASRLPERIAFRRGEIAALRAHAARRGVPLPDTDVLDHELPFLNYRLAALKLGLDYEGRPSDSPARLVGCAARALRREPVSARFKAAHLAWFAALAAAPRPVAARLIWLRDNRARVRRAAAALVGRDSAGREGA